MPGPPHRCSDGRRSLQPYCDVAGQREGAARRTTAHGRRRTTRRSSDGTILGRRWESAECSLGSRRARVLSEDRIAGGCRIVSRPETIHHVARRRVIITAELADGASDANLAMAIARNDERALAEVYRR